MNRAVEGDVVAVELLSKEEWAQPEGWCGCVFSPITLFASDVLFSPPPPLPSL